MTPRERFDVASVSVYLRPIQLGCDSSQSLYVHVSLPSSTGWLVYNTAALKNFEKGKKVFLADPAVVTVST